MPEDSRSLTAPGVVCEAGFREPLKVYERIVSRAILIALEIDWEGRRQVLAVEYANRESRGNWREFLLQLKERGLNGVQLIVSDDHPRLKAAIQFIKKVNWLCSGANRLSD